MKTTFLRVSISTVALVLLAAISAFSQVYTGLSFRAKATDTTAFNFPAGYGGMTYFNGRLWLKDAAGWFQPRRITPALPSNNFVFGTGSGIGVSSAIYTGNDNVFVNMTQSPPIITGTGLSINNAFGFGENITFNDSPSGGGTITDTGVFGISHTVGNNTNYFSGSDFLVYGQHNHAYGVTGLVGGSYAEVKHSGETAGSLFSGGGAAIGLTLPGSDLTKYITAAANAINISANTSAQTSGNGALAPLSSIFGGKDNHIPSTSEGASIIGGNGITARSSDPYQVYVSNFNIVSTPSNDNALIQILARDAATGQIKYRTAASILGGPYVDLATNQTNIAGNKSWTGDHLFAGAGMSASIGPSATLTQLGTETMRIQADQNANTNILINNATNGTSASSSINVINGSTTIGTFLRTTSASFTPVGIVQGNKSMLYSSGNTGLNVGTRDAQPFNHYTNDTYRGGYLSTGEYVWGATALLGTEKMLIRSDQNASTFALINNSTNNTSASAALAVTASGSSSNGAFIRTTPALFTSSGSIFNADAAHFYSSGVTGGSIYGTAGNAPIKFYTNGTYRGGFVGNANQFSVGGSVFSNETMMVRNDVNGPNYLAILNATNNASTYAGVLIRAGGGNFIDPLKINSFAPAFTSSGMDQASKAVISAANLNGMNIGTTVATPMDLWTNNTRQGGILSTGQWMVGANATALIGSEKILVQSNQNASTYMQVFNNTAGTAAESAVNLAVSGGNALIMRVLSSSFTSSGISQAGRAVIQESASNGLNIGTGSGVSMDFYTNNINRGKFQSSGEFIVGNGAIAGGAIVDFQSTTQGFSPPKMSTTQRDAISSPSDGLIIANTTLHTIDWYNGTAWASLGTGGGGLGGSTGSVDNAMLRADGTGGSTVQTSAVIVDDTGNIALGTSSTSGSSRGIAAGGSSTDVSLELNPKGSGGVVVNITGSTGEFAPHHFTANTSTAARPFRIIQSSTGTVANGFGTEWATTMQNASGSSEDATAITHTWVDATNASEDGKLTFKVAINSALTEVINFNGTSIESSIPYKLKGYTVAALPSSPQQGMIVYVTDSNTAIFNATVAGGGSNIVLAFYDGTNWKVH